MPGHIISAQLLVTTSGIGVGLSGFGSGTGGEELTVLPAKDVVAVGSAGGGGAGGNVSLVLLLEPPNDRLLSELLVDGEDDEGINDVLLIHAADARPPPPPLPIPTRAKGTIRSFLMRRPRCFFGRGDSTDRVGEGWRIWFAICSWIKTGSALIETAAAFFL